MKIEVNDSLIRRLKNYVIPMFKNYENNESDHKHYEEEIVKLVDHFVEKGVDSLDFNMKILSSNQERSVERMREEREIKDLKDKKKKTTNPDKKKKEN